MMASNTNRLSSPIIVAVAGLLLLLVTLQPTANAAELLNSICQPPVDGFHNLTEYDANVKSLLKLLANVNASDGFGLEGAGPPHSQRVFGLINCRGDAPAPACRACAEASTRAARALCPGNLGVVLWYDDCLLKYSSDFDLLGFDDLAHKFTLSSPVSVTGDPARFDSRVKGLLTRLINKAVTNPKLFAKGKTKADGNTTVYGMVECTRDLAPGTCQESLKEILTDGFSVCCSGVKGGRYVTPSTMFRFEVYPF